MALALSRWVHAPNYALALASVAIAGLGGSFFHPAATALIARLYPQSAGPRPGVHRNRRQRRLLCRANLCGLAGIAIRQLADAGSRPWLHGDRRRRALSVPGPTGRRRAGSPASAENCRCFSTRVLWFVFIAMAFFFSLRDFAGFGMSSLGSLFLQNAEGFDIKTTGITLSGIYLASAISNPLFGHFSDRGRIRWIAMLLVISAGARDRLSAPAQGDARRRAHGVRIFPHGPPIRYSRRP